MKYGFDPARQLVVVKTALVGPVGDMMVQLAVDTGASSTVIGWNSLKLVGYGPTNAFGQVHMTTGSGTELAPKTKLAQIETLGKRRRGFSVIAHDLPPTATVDGLLGLDFFRKSRLTIDFRKNFVRLD